MKTKVVFRVFPEGDVIALFPDLNEGGGMVLSYQHLGQHSSANKALITKLRAASPMEFESLAAELARIGYELTVSS